MNRLRTKLLLLWIDCKQAFLAPFRRCSRKPPLAVVLTAGVLVVLSPLLIYFGLHLFFGSRLHTYPLAQPADQIAQIRLVHIADGIGLYSHPLDEIPTMAEARQTVRADVDPTEFAAFLDAFHEVPCHEMTNDPHPYVQGGTIQILYRDGTREWISDSGTFFCPAGSGEADMTWYYFEEDGFSALLTAYGYTAP